jgi:hypothetical protein
MRRFSIWRVYHPSSAIGRSVARLSGYDATTEGKLIFEENIY